MDTYSPERSENKSCVVISCNDVDIEALCQLLSALTEPADFSLLLVSKSETLDRARLANAIRPVSELQLNLVSVTTDLSLPGIYVVDSDINDILDQNKLCLLSADDLDHLPLPVRGHVESLARDKRAYSVSILHCASGGDPASAALGLNPIAQQIMHDEFTPQWAIVDDEFQILESSDQASRYLHTGAGIVEKNIIQQVQKTVQSELRSLLEQARSERQRVVHDHWLLQREDRSKRVTLTVQPMPVNSCGGQLLMVIFQESSVLSSNAQALENIEINGQFQQSQSTVVQLEKALRSTQADLMRTARDLEAANDDFENQLIISQTAMLLMKQQAEEAREQAEYASRFKNEFLTNMSHEIRTPMTAILGYADLLEGHLNDPDNLQSVRTIRRNGRFLINLINDILDLCKVESGKLELELVPVSPVDIIEQTLGMMQLQADRKQLTLRVEYVGKLPLTLETDPVRLRQILINLTGNAVKFTEQGGVTLRIKYRETPGPSLLFQVIDTGIGMTMEQQAEVFDAFCQADSSISRRFGGSGLGLSISQRLAASMGGQISIHSEPGKGSTLTLQLPVGGSGQIVLAAPEKPAAVDAGEALPVPRLPYRVLAVDDRRDILHVVQHILEDAGATVGTASGAAEAFEKVRQAQAANSDFQAIVLDMQMPGINGYNAATVLRKQGFNEPIIALTANAMKGEREKCLAAGCTDYLTKPIDRNLLLESLDRHVTHSHSLSTNKIARQCVLLVEDHAESARVLARLLERSGHTVHSAHSAAQAMAVLESIQPTVILSDIGLPDENGYSLVARMRQHPGLKACVFVALTGSSELDEAHQYVFDHHMTKPIEIESLRNFLQQPIRNGSNP